MDKYNQIIHDVQSKTEAETIRWELVNANLYDGILLNAFRVIRAFKADYPIGKRNFTLLYVERKIDVHDEFGDSTEKYGFELIVLNEKTQIALSLYEGLVDRDDLLKLSGLIDEHNDIVKDFFDAFDESGAA